MKLLFCRLCGDIVNLRSSLSRCRCGAGRGRYIDTEKVEIWGERSEVILIGASHLEQAVRQLDALPHSEHALWISNTGLASHTHPRIIRRGRWRSDLLAPSSRS